MAMSRVESRREDVRAEILDAAWDIAREEGLVGLSLRELAARIGMQAPSLYSYFDSKDAILDRMFMAGYEQFDVATRLPDASQVGVRAVLVAGARSFIEFCNDDTVRFQLLFQHAIPGWHPSPAAYATAERVYARFAREFASAGIASPESLDTWTALVQGLASQQVANDPGGDRWLQLVDDVADMFLAHHAPQHHTVPPHKGARP